MITVQNLFGIKKKYDGYRTLKEFLVSEYPTGFNSNIDIYIDNNYYDLLNEASFDIEIADKDVLILMTPNGGITAAMVGKWLVGLAISATVSYAIGKIFAPDYDIPSSIDTSERNTSSKDSSTYSLNSQQNEAKRGEAIPLIYGTVRTYPPLITPPYYRYEDNEEYLYQLMVVGHNRLYPQQIYISDTPVEDIPSTDFEYRLMTEDDFGDLPTYDPNYIELVKTLPSPNNLEVRGKPSLNEFNVSFDDAGNITFYPNNGIPPDLSSLQAGSTLDISGTNKNNGTFTVASLDLSNPDAQIVTVNEPTVLEPDTSDPNDGENWMWSETYLVNYANEGHIRAYRVATLSPFLQVGTEMDLVIEADNWVNTIRVTVTMIFTWPETYFELTPHDSTVPDGTRTSGLRRLDVYRNIDNGNLYTKAIITMETSYGAYRFDEVTREGRPLEFLEIDVHFPTGVYNIDQTTGDFTNRTVEFRFTLCHTDLDGNLIGCVEKNESVTAADSGQLRFTYRYPVSDVPMSQQAGQYYIMVKRITPEPEDNTANDKLYISRVKGLYGFSDKSKWGNITAMWCKVRASNSISAISSFQINGFFTNSVTRLDDVVRDIYSNPVYGGALDENDLVFYDVTDDDIVDIAIDTKLTVYDAINTVCKPQFFYAYPFGTQLIVKKDKPQDRPVYLFNETNVVKNSMVLTYLFKEQNYDCIEVKYFDKEDMWVQKSLRYPDTGLRPRVIEIHGIADEPRAIAAAQRAYNQDRYNRKSIEFETDIQGYIPEPLDKISVSSYHLKEGIGGFITKRTDEGVGVALLTLDCDYDLIPPDALGCDEVLGCDETLPCDRGYNSHFDKIVFRNSDGSVSDIHTFEIVDHMVIRVHGLPDWVGIYPDPQDNTAFTIGAADELVTDYLVTGVTPSGEDKMKIDAVIYDERIYN